jgi:hypothetical protein
MGIFFFEILIWLVLALILWNRGRAGMETLAISFGAGKRRATDVSDPEAPLPPELKSHVSILSELGFSRLGEVKVALPGGQAVKSRIFLSEDGTVFAELAETQRGLVVFTTVFPDEAVMETGFPVGENIATRNFRSHTITKDLGRAYRHQLEQAEAFGKTHGAPRKVASMRDYLDWDAMYRRRYVKRKMRRHTWIGFGQVLAMVYGFLAMAAAAVYWLGTDMSTVDPMVIILFLLIVALSPAALLAFVLPFIGDWGNHRETKAS